MSHSDRDVLGHVLDEIDYLAAESSSMEAAAFFADETHKRAFVRSIEVVGEAVKNLSGATKALAPEVDWRAVAGMRDHLIHGYFDIDYEIVWDVVKRKMPELQRSIERLIPSNWRSAELIVTDPGNLWGNVNRWLDRFDGYALELQLAENEGSRILRFVPLADPSQQGLKISNDAAERSLWRDISAGASLRTPRRYRVRYRWSPLPPSSLPE